jgi:hypothetical protein
MFAYIRQDRVAHIAESNCEHLDGAQAVVECETTVNVGDAWNGETFMPYVAPIETRKISPIEFKLLFTSTERVAVYASTDPVLIDWRDILDDPRLSTIDLHSASTHSAIDYLVATGVITEERASVIKG